ncbi:TolC family protein [Sulfurimonas sp.]
MKKVILVASVLSTMLLAQTLTLHECIDKTLKNHPDVKTFALKVKQSHAGYKSAFADYLPQINLSAQYNATETYVFPVNGSFHTLNDDGWNVGANLKQKIWDFSKTSSKVNATKVDEKISKLSLADAKALLAYKVKTFYELMVVQKEAVGVRKKDLESKQAYYEQSKALVKNGLKTQADASRFLSAVYLAQDNLAIAQTDYAKAKNSLSLYIGEPISTDVELENDFNKHIIVLDAQTQKEVLATNKQLKIYTKNINKNSLLYKSSKASHYGSIDLVASYSHINTLNEYDAKQVGITVNIPLYSGGRVSAQAQQAKIGTQISKEQELSYALSLKEETSNLLLDIQRYSKTIQAKKAQLDSAKKTKQVLDGRYAEGLSTYLEVLDATSLVLNARLGLLEAYYSRNISIYKIDYLKGKIYE